MSDTNTLDTKTFSLVDALKGRSYPKATVTVFSDVEAYYEWEYVNDLINSAETGEEANALEPRLAELAEQIKESALEVHMSGFAPGVTKRLNAEARAKFRVDADEYIDDKKNVEAFRWLNLSTIAASIIKTVRLSDGAVDEHKFTVEDVEALEDFLPPEEFNKVLLKSFDLSFRALAFDQAVDSDF